MHISVEAFLTLIVAKIHVHNILAGDIEDDASDNEHDDSIEDELRDASTSALPYPRIHKRSVKYTTQKESVTVRSSAEEFELFDPIKALSQNVNGIENTPSWYIIGSLPADKLVRGTIYFLFVFVPRTST